MIEQRGYVEPPEVLLTLQIVHDALRLVAGQNSELVGFLHVSAILVGDRLVVGEAAHFGR